MIIKKDNGFTLIDALLWFAVFGVMIAVLYTKFNTGMTEGRNKNEIDALTQTINQMRQILTGTNPAVNTDYTSSLSAAMTIPKPFSISGATIVNSNKGTVVYTNVDEASFKVDINSAPKSLCAELATNINDFDTFKGPGGGSGVSKPAMTPSTISNHCNTTGTATLSFLK